MYHQYFSCILYNLSLIGDYKSFMAVTNPSRGEKEFRRKDFVKKFSSKSTKRVSIVIALIATH